MAGFCSSFGTLRSCPAAKLRRLLQTVHILAPENERRLESASVGRRREQFLFKNGIMVVWTVASVGVGRGGRWATSLRRRRWSRLDTCPSIRKGWPDGGAQGKKCVTDKHSPLQLAFGSCCPEYTFRAEARPFLVNFIDFLDGLCPLYVAMIMFLFSTRAFEGCS